LPCHHPMCTKDAPWNPRHAKGHANACGVPPARVRWRKPKEGGPGRRTGLLRVLMQCCTRQARAQRLERWALSCRDGPVQSHAASTISRARTPLVHRMCPDGQMTDGSPLVSEIGSRSRCMQSAAASDAASDGQHMFVRLRHFQHHSFSYIARYRPYTIVLARGRQSVCLFSRAGLLGHCVRLTEAIVVVVAATDSQSVETTGEVESSIVATCDLPGESAPSGYQHPRDAERKLVAKVAG